MRVAPLLGLAARRREDGRHAAVERVEPCGTKEGCSSEVPVVSLSLVVGRLCQFNTYSDIYTYIYIYGRHAAVERVEAYGTEEGCGLEFMGFPCLWWGVAVPVQHLNFNPIYIYIYRSLHIYIYI